MNPREGSVSKYQSRQLLMTRVLTLVGLVLAASTFLTLDWFRSAAIQRTRESASNRDPCRTRDPVRHHALKPNCASIEHWGRDVYEIPTLIGLQLLQCGADGARCRG